MFICKTSRSRGSTGDIFQLNDSLGFFFKNVQGLSVCMLYGKKSLKGLKVAKYSAEVVLVCVRRGSRWQRAMGICGVDVDIVADRNK